MASITNSNAKKYRYLGHEEDGPEKPTGDTVREKLVKRLIQKQLDKSTSLSQQLQEKRDFITATSEVSVTASTSGLASYQQYKHLEESLNVNQVLQSSGLTHAEIQLLHDKCERKSSLETPLVKKERLRAIEDKLNVRQEKLEQFDSSSPEQFHGAVPLNRHDFEEECNLVPANTDTEKLTSCLVRLQPHHNQTIPDDHPINHIKEIADDLFPVEASCEATSQNISRKRKYEASEARRPPSSSFEVPEVNFMYLTEKPNSLWDMKTIPKIIGDCGNTEKNERFAIVTKSKSAETIIVRAKESGKETHGKVDQSKPYVLTLESNELISLNTIQSNKKSIHELKAMDKFKNYSEGKPSATLYIKNISPAASPKHLAALMGHFEESGSPRIQYRLLTGRMKGQAFVTFPNTEMAMGALNLCNGYVLHDKPIVIEYGKK